MIQPVVEMNHMVVGHGKHFLYTQIFNYYLIKFAETSETKHDNGEALGEPLMKDEWEDGFACEFCDELFSSVEEVVQHRSTHPEANDDSHEQ